MLSGIPRAGDISSSAAKRAAVDEEMGAVLPVWAAARLRLDAVELMNRGVSMTLTSA
jgi:hypothetical protein